VKRFLLLFFAVLILLGYATIGRRLSNSNRQMSQAFDSEIIAADGISQNSPAAATSLGKACMKMLLLVVLLGALAGGIIYMRRQGKRFGGRTDGKIHITDTLQFGAKHYLTVVEYEENRYLLSVTPQGMVCIDKFSEKKEKNESQKTFIGNKIC
jgi:flagellar biogenesis protein FliO